MPPQLQQLMQDRRMLAMVAGGLALIIILVIAVAMMSGGGKAKNGAQKLNDSERILATVDNPGKAIEIQALMARENVQIDRQDAEGGKYTLSFQDGATTDDRDKALITLVQSGLMDKNVGLEVFDKGDLTASREEKRIKLIRARNGELARLIRKIEPIQDASVFISMPEPTIFKSEMQPPSATVQVTLNPGEHLAHDKVRSIINLLVGSIEGLDAKHVSLTDTNGTVYNSVLSTSDEMMDTLQERDQYMEQKVKEQLDKLIGPDKYVVTVATYLREAPKEQLTLDYDPHESTVAKSSKFSENLNSQQKAEAGGPASSYIPEGVATGEDGENSHKGYSRNGQEMEYNSGKTQTTENFQPGMIEDITVAVTINGGDFPTGMSKTDFQTLVAHSASPLVKPENVTIVTGQPDALKPITPVVESRFNVPWWAWILGGGIVLLLFLLLMRALTRPVVEPDQMEAHDRELQQLRELTRTQAQQIETTQQQAQQILQSQQQQIAQLSSQQQQVMPNTQESAQVLRQTLNELHQALHQSGEDEEDEALGTHLRSWIETP